ncbi:Zn-ribbon containing protein [Haloferax sp. KTX1]|uniref:OapC/ArvC family zinc-ribbon domain-containing protein n=1 Tax=Haloferax sp. KTX1 TaxID=2600597 RepID=UPI0011DCCC48|nr:Zn-ribbon containing protein [Haloferax sp. KTX1]
MPHQCTTCGKVFPDGSKEMLSGCPSCGGNKFQFKPASSGSAPASASDDTPSTGGAGARDLTSSAADAVRDRARRQSHPDSTDEESMTVSDWANADADAPQRTETGDAAGSTRSEPSSTDATDTADATDDPETKPRGWGEWPSAPGESPGADPKEPEESRNEPREEPAAGHPDSSPDSASPPNREPGSINARETDEDNSQRSARSDVVTPEELAAADANRRGSAAETPPEAPSDPDAAAGQSADAAPGDADGTVIEPSSDDRPNLDQLREELNDQFESIKIVNPGQYELNLMELYDRDEYIISLREDGRYVIEVPDSWGPGNRED